MIENIAGNIMLILANGRIWIGHVRFNIFFTKRMDWELHHHRKMDAYGFCEMAIIECTRLGFNQVDLVARLEDGSLLHVRMWCADMLANFKYTTTAKGYERQGYLDIATLKRLNILNPPPPSPVQENLFV